MKSFLKFLFTALLRIVARAVVRRYRPHIVMVTGSVGKTSTKDAVAAVLAARFFVSKSQKSFNSEFGVPFTILGVDNPWDNPFAWFVVLRRSLALLLLPNHYPNMLVLEVGADRPGDLAKILRIATPEAVVVKQLPEIPVHVESYTSPEQVREEEFSPAYALAAGAPLIVSADDPYALDLAVHTSARIISFGIAEGAMVRITDRRFYEENGRVAGMQAEITTGTEHGTVVVRGAVGEVQLYPAAAAVALASAYEIPLHDALKRLAEYIPPPGRGRIFAGKNDSIILDDSYNASPAATEQALHTLGQFPHTGRRIAVLGDMLELGRYSVMEHERIGNLARKVADLVVGVGIRARAYGSSDASGIIFYEHSRAAAAALPAMLEPGDVVLVKGSQSIRMERVVEALLADPADTSKLVRQEPKWLAR